MPLQALTLPTTPELELGPLTLAWHGLFTAIGLAVGIALAIRFARERGLDRDRVLGLCIVAALSGIVGARLFYLAEQDAGALLEPGEWLGTTGFSFYGAILAAVPAGFVYLRKPPRLPYLDAIASGFGLAMAIGRIGDILIGEHLGPPTDLPWGIQYSNPEALAPSVDRAYHPGALYEALVGIAIFAVVWRSRERLRRPGEVLLSVLGLYAIGRFVIFFWRSDSPESVLGLSTAQLTSAALLAGCLLGYAWLRAGRAEHQAPS